MGLLLGSLRKCRGEDGVEHRESEHSLKHHTTPLGLVLFSRRNNRIWYFTYQEQRRYLSMNPRQEIERRALQRLMHEHYDCRPKENERPSNAATRKGFLSDCSAQMGAIISEMRWTKARVKWMKREAISRWICLIPLSCKRDGFYLWRLQQRGCSSKSGTWEIVIMKVAKKAAGKWDYSHNITLADKRKSHSEETGNETRKQVAQLFLQV